MGIHLEFIHFLRNPSHFDSGTSVKVDWIRIHFDRILTLISNKPAQDTYISQTLTPIHSFDT